MGECKRNSKNMRGVKQLNQKIELVKKELLKYGIHNEKELDEAIKKMQPINIGCMVSPIEIKKEANG